MEVLGIDPIHRLVVPRVIAATVVALLLNALVIVIGLAAASCSVSICRTCPAAPTCRR